MESAKSPNMFYIGLSNKTPCLKKILLFSGISWTLLQRKSEIPTGKKQRGWYPRILTNGVTLIVWFLLFILQKSSTYHLDRHSPCDVMLPAGEHWILHSAYTTGSSGFWSSRCGKKSKRCKLDVFAWVCANFVPRVSHLTAPWDDERPWERSLRSLAVFKQFEGDRKAGKPR